MGPRYAQVGETAHDLARRLRREDEETRRTVRHRLAQDQDIPENPLQPGQNELIRFAGPLEAIKNPDGSISICWTGTDPAPASLSIADAEGEWVEAATPVSVHYLGYPTMNDMPTNGPSGSTMRSTNELEQNPENMRRADLGKGSHPSLDRIDRSKLAQERRRHAARDRETKPLASLNAANAKFWSSDPPMPAADRSALREAVASATAARVEVDRLKRAVDRSLLGLRERLRSRGEPL